MNTAASTTTPPRRCQFCDRAGLPILPLRYAVARADMGKAPDLSAPFGPGVSDIALPAHLAHYTLRLLRPGYLYVYDEHRREWTAYQAVQGGYLFEFDPHAKVPPGGWGQAHFACSRQGDAMIARCLTVKDAAQATRVWLAFSDVIWTEAVLRQHEDTEYRQTHMRCIDMAKVRQGASQPHAAALSGLAGRVAEFAATPADLDAETRAYVKRYLPIPYTQPAQLLEDSEETRLALRLSSRLITDLLPRAVTTTSPLSGRTPSAAWAFSLLDIEADAAQAHAFEQWAATAAQPWQPAMVALDDPVGIALELNGLVLQHTAEFSEEPQRKWRHETALTIAALKQAVMEGAVKKEAAKRKGWADVVTNMGEYGDPQAAMILQTVVGPDGKTAAEHIEAARQADHARIEAEVAQSADTIGEEAWQEDYATLFDEAAQQAELSPSSDYARALDEHARTRIEPLDESFLAWLKSQPMERYFLHNFDTAHLGSGLSYIAILGSLFTMTGGRAAVVRYLEDELVRDPTQRTALVIRGFAFNQDALVRAWIQGATAAQEEGLAPTLAEAGEKVYDGFKDVILAGNEGAVFHGLSGYVYRLSAGIVNVLSKEVTSATARLAARLPTRMLYGILGSIARTEGLTLIDLHTSLSPRQAARMVSRALASLLGGGANQYVSAAEQRLSDVPGSFRGVVLIDEAQARALRIARGGRTPGSAQVSLLVTPQVMEEALHGMAARLANGEVKGGVVGAILTAICGCFVHREYASAKGDERAKLAWDWYGATLTSLVGGSMEIAGHALEHTAFGATQLSKQFRILNIQLSTLSEWLTGSGKLLGAVGGVVGAVLCFWDADEEWQRGHYVIMVAYGALGLLSVISTILLFTTFVALGFIAGIIIGLIIIAIAMFKQNKIQDWLENAGFFGDGQLKPFKGLAPQMLALAKLGED